MSDPQPDPSRRTFAKALGPGLLFAGAAIGVSHLVQSTRAGAIFGLALIAFVVLANVFKYPAFQFGPRYAAATGTSLLEGYRRQGKWALVLYTLLTFGTMLTVQAAVVLMTAGILLALGVSAGPVVVSLVVTAICAGLLAVGRFPLLDKLIKVTVVVLTIATFIATALVVGQVDWSGPWFPSGEQWNAGTVLLIAGLIGWMPSAIDISVWHSLWTLARKDETCHAPSLRETLLDFNIGYIGTAILALCFVILGAGVLYGTPAADIPKGAGAFAGRVISLYAPLGEWATPVIGVSALAVMFSTSLTVVDGFPRALSRLWARYQGPEVADTPESPAEKRVYWGAMAFLAIGSLVVIDFFVGREGGLTPLVIVATLLSFLTSPVLAWLNHRAMLGPEVPAGFRPSRKMVAFSLAGIAFNAAVAIVYVVFWATS